MNRLKKRWLMLGLAWSCVVFISGWNISQISHIQSRRQELERMKIDRHYVAMNTSHIQQVRTQKKRLVHEVESLDLGFLIVESELKQLSDAHTLKKTRVEAKSESDVATSAAVYVWTNGTIPNLTAWLSAVEDHFPYLSVSGLEIARDNAHQTAQLTAILTYRYGVFPMENREGL